MTNEERKYFEFDNGEDVIRVAWDQGSNFTLQMPCKGEWLDYFNVARPFKVKTEDQAIQEAQSILQEVFS